MSKLIIETILCYAVVWGIVELVGAVLAVAFVWWIVRRFLHDLGKLNGNDGHD
jgi:hypothetical protein